ncbi:hypothetical protein ACTXT7_005126 [Hymenolepis weldensis]
MVENKILEPLQLIIEYQCLPNALRLSEGAGRYDQFLILEQLVNRLMTRTINR